MELNSKTLARELRHAFSRFPQAREPRALNQRTTPLLTAAGLFRWRNRFSVARVRSRLGSVLSSRHPVFVLRLERSFSRRAAVRVFRCHTRIGRVRLFSGFRRLLFFLFFLRRFLNPRQLSQDFFPLLRRFAAAG